MVPDSEVVAGGKQALQRGLQVGVRGFYQLEEALLENYRRAGPEGFPVLPGCGAAQAQARETESRRTPLKTSVARIISARSLRQADHGFPVAYVAQPSRLLALMLTSRSPSLKFRHRVADIS